MRQAPANRGKKPKSPQIFQDETQEVDGTRTRRDNETLASKDAEGAKQKSDLVDRVHGLSR